MSPATAMPAWTPLMSHQELRELIEEVALAMGLELRRSDLEGVLGTLLRSQQHPHYHPWYDGLSRAALRPVIGQFILRVLINARHNRARKDKLPEFVDYVAESSEVAFGVPLSKGDRQSLRDKLLRALITNDPEEAARPHFFADFYEAWLTSLGGRPRQNAEKCPRWFQPFFGGGSQAAAPAPPQQNANNGPRKRSRGGAYWRFVQKPTQPFWIRPAEREELRDWHAGARIKPGSAAPLLADALDALLAFRSYPLGGYPPAVSCALPACDLLYVCLHTFISPHNRTYPEDNDFIPYLESRSGSFLVHGSTVPTGNNLQTRRRRIKTGLFHRVAYNTLLAKAWLQLPDNSAPPLPADWTGILERGIVPDGREQVCPASIFSDDVIKLLAPYPGPDDMRHDLLQWIASQTHTKDQAKLCQLSAFIQHGGQFSTKNLPATFQWMLPALSFMVIWYSLPLDLVEHRELRAFFQLHFATWEPAKELRQHVDESPGEYEAAARRAQRRLLAELLARLLDEI